MVLFSRWVEQKVGNSTVRKPEPLTEKEHKTLQLVEAFALLLGLLVVVLAFVLNLPGWLRVLAVLLAAALFTPCALFETYQEYLETFERHRPPRS